MRPPKRVGPAPEAAPPDPAADPALAAALRRVLEVIHREHPLGPNQILVLASELQRLGVHRLVEEHLRKFRRQLDGG